MSVCVLAVKQVLMVEPIALKLDVFIKMKHRFVNINLQYPTESYQLITFANHHRTGSG